MAGGAGKKKIQITRILDKAKRRVTFSKRKKGLFKKASELDTLCGSDTAIITFSEAGTIFTAGRPSLVHSLLFGGAAGASVVGGPAAPAPGSGDGAGEFDTAGRLDSMSSEELAAQLAAVKKVQLKIELLMLQRNNNNDGNAGNPITTPPAPLSSVVLEPSGSCSTSTPTLPLSLADYGFGDIHEELDEFMMVDSGCWSKEEEEVNYEELLALLD